MAIWEDLEAVHECTLIKGDLPGNRTNDKGALRNGPNGTMLLDVPSDAVIEATGKQQVVQISGKNTVWSEIPLKEKTGWVNEAYLEEYAEKFSKIEVHIANLTPDPVDAAQYLFVQGGVKQNLCGEFSVAFILGKDIDSLLNDWKEKTLAHYNNILAGSKDLTTGPGDLELILKLYGYSRKEGHVMDFKIGLTDPVAGYLPSIGRMKNVPENYFLIAGVHIDSVTGKLRGKVSVTEWC